jgi:arabinofuranan 3-O-arabinosyltransferase
VEIDAKAVAAPGDAALDLLESTPNFSISATSTFGSMPVFAPRNLVDGDDSTTWVAGSSDGITPDRSPRVSLRWNEPRRLDHIMIRPAPGYSLPQTLHLSANSETRTVTVSNDGEASFEPFTTNAVTVTIDLPATQPVITNATGVGLSTLEFPALHDLVPGRIDRSQAVALDCSHGLAVDVAGTSRRFSVRATLDDIISQRPVDATPCDTSAVALYAGEQLLTSASSGLFVVSHVRLIDRQTARVTAGSARDVRVQSWSSDSRDVNVGPGSAAYLAVNENSNEGWHATINGRPLESVVLDGWRQGYSVPAGDGGVVQLRYEPTRQYRGGLMVGIVLVLLLLVGLLLPEHRLLPAGITEGHWPTWVMIGAPFALTLAIGGPFALTIVAAIALLRRATGRIPSVVAVVLVAATVGAAGNYGLGSSLLGPSGKLVSALVVGALAALASTLLPDWDGRARPPRNVHFTSEPVP